MAMDALTKIALDNLLDNLLPSLNLALSGVRKQDLSKRDSNEELRYLISEAYQLLTILGKWAGCEESSTSINSEHQEANEEMSDDVAMMMLQEMDDMSSPSKKPSPLKTDDMSDDEAMMLLREMDEVNSSTSKEMSDDAARAMLAQMDDEPKPKEKPVNPPVAQKVEEKPQIDDHGVQHSADEHLEEINEFSSSEFGADPDMVRDFMMNATELMQILDEQILQLESDPQNKNTIEEIFRAAHTLKGAAGMFGYQAIERVMHRMENYFDQVRRGKLIANPDAIDVIFEGIDVLKTLMGGVESQKPTGFKTVPIVRSLTLLAEGKYTKTSDSTPKVKDQVVEKANSTSTSQEAKATTKESANKNTDHAAKKKEDSTIRVDIERLDMLVNLVGELVTDRTRFMNIEEELHHTAPQMKIANNLSETVQLFGRHMNEIQDTIMKVRMVPIGNAFNKFTRIIRDLARQLGKEINLEIEGESTELDKTLVEQIADPLVHLIRNSCDHGIEMPDVRAKNGKSTTGTILLSAKQEGNQIIITIKDDGKGIPRDIIRKKALEKGLIKEEDVLTDKDVFALIFEPGFSTAEQITNISGRGVGMDVVKKQIQKLKGSVDIDSELGKGTTIKIQLPLTLAILQSLLVRTETDTFAIPINAVVESIRISPSEIQTVGGAEVIKRRDQVLPLYHLSDVLELEKKDQDFWYREEMTSVAKQKLAKMKEKKKERLFVVVIGNGDKKFGIVVDTLLYQQEIVIKPLGDFMKDVPCIAGGAILGSGEVVLVLDVVYIDSINRSKSRSKLAA